jgi:DNA helicase II / ATP-dependent DNA helicase PcrA
MQQQTSSLETLNAQQQQAVLTTTGPLLVIAGAGSGKTRVITTRIAHLLTTGSKASEIIALTFTNKAAREMLERIEAAMQNSTTRPFVGTFHSYCLQLMKRYNHLLAIPQFTILDAEDQQSLLQNIIKRTSREERLNPKTISHHISRYKNAHALKVHLQDDLFFDEQFIELYRAYEREKAASNCYDFDDLLLESYTLFTKHTEVFETFHATIKHVLVDEYQDTNHIQGALLKKMVLTAEGNLAITSLCAVGDEDQSIYSWRGATIENIIAFAQMYPGTTTIKIEQNYRSVQPILDVANHVIKKNKERNPKKLWTEKKASDRVRILQCMSGYQEADIISDLLSIGSVQTPLKGCAILYRAHYQSRTIEETLIKNSIRYKIIGGIQFYERKEIKDLLAYLKLVVNPYDRISFLRVINCPPRGLGAKFEEQLQELWDAQPLLSTLELIDFMITNSLVPQVKKTALQEFKQIIQKMDKDDRPSVALAYLIGAIDYVSFLKKSFTKDEAEPKIENIRELQRAAEHFETKDIITVAALLDEISLMQEHYAKDAEDQDYVQLMTLHAAKGLEFDTVFIPGLEETIFPSSRSIDDPKTLEEERRLFYVGITRAKERLVLTYARYRYSFGTMTEQFASRFLREIPTTLVPVTDCSYLDKRQCESYVREWLAIKKTPSRVLTFGISKKTWEPQEEGNPKESSLSVPRWKAYQTVQHITFGIGTIEKIEEQASQNPTVVVRFKSGLKKLKSSFLASL